MSGPRHSHLTGSQWTILYHSGERFSLGTTRMAKEQSLPMWSLLVPLWCITVALLVPLCGAALPLPRLNDIAPPFSAMSHTGKSVSLADFAGRKVILWFYPRAGTEGCTAEGRGFQNLLHAFDDQNVAVVGVSNDKVIDNARFADQNGFQFPLLSDKGNKLAIAYGAAQRRYDPHRRVAAVIDERGYLVKYYDPAGTSAFAERVLADLRPIIPDSDTEELGSRYTRTEL